MGKKFAKISVFVFVLAMAVSWGIAQAQDTPLFAVDQASANLYTIDPNNATTLSTVPILFPAVTTIFGARGLAVHPETGDLWVVLNVFDGVVNRQALGTVDPVTGVFTEVGDPNPPGDKGFAGLAFDDSAILYGVTGDGATVAETLYTLSQSDASRTLVTNLGNGNDGESIGFNPQNGLMYHISGNGVPNTDEIFESIDLNALTVNPITLSGVDYNGSGALTYWRAGNVFLMSDIGANLHTLTVTGLSSFVGGLGFLCKGLAFGIPPVVTKVNSVNDTGDGELMEGEVATVDITQLLVTFNKQVANPPGDTDPNDVTNPDNYRLFDAGADGVFDTMVCGPPQGDDTTVAVNSATYDSNSLTATLSVNGGTPLPAGSYRLMVCGSTSIEDLVGVPLDGNKDNIEGDDFLLNFMVSSGSAIQFSSAAYTVSEGDGTATITVTRTGDPSGAVSVDYATSNGSAIDGTDYEAASGTLDWADGDSDNKTFTVTILDDAVVEPDETVNLTLSNPTGGAMLGSPSTAVLTINDDDAVIPPELEISVSSVSVAPGDSADVTVSGGQSPYAATSSDTSIATAAVSGDTVSITGVAEGQTTVIVSDAGGDNATIDVTVSSTPISTVGGCAAGSNVSATIDTTQVSNLNLLLCQQPPVAMNGRLYVSLEVPSVFPGLLFFRPADSMVPLENGSYVVLVKDSGGFLDGAADFYFFEGLLTTSAADLNFDVGTAGLNGLTIIFRTWILATGLPINEVNLQLIQNVSATFQ